MRQNFVHVIIVSLRRDFKETLENICRCNLMSILKKIKLLQEISGRFFTMTDNLKLARYSRKRKREARKYCINGTLQYTL